MNYEQLAEALAFCGNSLLAPMTQTVNAGLDAPFWENFPTFDDANVEREAAACAQWACDFGARMADAGEDPVLACSVEFTRLFVGPPRPAAAPWETMQRGDAEQGKQAAVGFGAATFEMRGLLRELGLELHNENRQYEDHMGIELLYLSELCRRRATAEDDCQGEPYSDEHIAEFIQAHPLAWIDSLVSKVHDAAPSGYFEHLLALSKALLECLLASTN